MVVWLPFPKWMVHDFLTHTSDLKFNHCHWMKGGFKPILSSVAPDAQLAFLTFCSVTFVVGLPCNASKGII